MNLTQLFSRLWQYISLRRRGQFWLLLVLMPLASFAEIFSIGAVQPFLGMLTAILIALLLSVAPIIAVVAFGGFGLIYAFIIRLTRQRLLVNSQCVAHETT